MNSNYLWAGRDSVTILDGGRPHTEDPGFQVSENEFRIGVLKYGDHYFPEDDRGIDIIVLSGCVSINHGKEIKYPAHPIAILSGHSILFQVKSTNFTYVCKYHKKGVK